MGAGCDGCVWGCACWLCVSYAARPCCFVRGSRAKVHQKFGKPRHIGDRRKAGDKTSQTITFNYGESVGFHKLLINLVYLCHRNLLITLDLVSVAYPPVVRPPVLYY